MYVNHLEQCSIQNMKQLLIFPGYSKVISTVVVYPNDVIQPYRCPEFWRTIVQNLSILMRSLKNVDIL